MSIHFSQEKLNGQERKEIIEEVQKRMREAALAAIKLILEAFLEAAVSAKLGREKGEPRRVSRQARQIDWACGHCGCRDAHQFTRDGHYLRALETGWGHIKALKVPMLECQCCGHDVVCHFTILEKYQRFWLDLDQDVLFGSGLCESLRQSRVSGGVQWWVAVWGCAPSMSASTRSSHCSSTRTRTPSVTSHPWCNTMVFGCGCRSRLTRTSATNGSASESRRKGKKVVLLVALGFWPDGTRQILDWEVADSESKAGWERLVHRVWQRGVWPEKGLQAVIRDGNGELGEALALVYGTTIVEQRCIFHKLRNVADKCREELKGDDHKEMRTQVLEQARTVYQAESARGAPEHAWRPLPTPGEHACPRRWLPSNGISSRRL